MPRRSSRRARGEGQQGTPALVALRRAGVAYTARPYDHDPAVRSYGAEAAEALGVAPDRVFKTLVVDADGRLVVAVVAVGDHLEVKALAGVVGAKRATMAEPTAAERATGYVVGGISPLGGRQRLPTVVDRRALAHPTVFVSAGRRGLQVELAPRDLVELCQAQVADIARSGDT